MGILEYIDLVGNDIKKVKFTIMIIWTHKLSDLTLVAHNNILNAHYTPIYTYTWLVRVRRQWPDLRILYLPTSVILYIQYTYLLYYNI